MNTQRTAFRGRTLAIVLFGVLALSPASVRAAPVPHDSPHSARHAYIQQPILASSFGEWMQSIWSGLASRRAMMRFGAVILVVALVAIWWRRT
jgi:hypothetical protein